MTPQRKSNNTKCRKKLKDILKSVFLKYVFVCLNIKMSPAYRRLLPSGSDIKLFVADALVCHKSIGTITRHWNKVEQTEQASKRSAFKGMLILEKPVQQTPIRMSVGRKSQNRLLKRLRVACLGRQWPLKGNLFMYILPFTKPASALHSLFSYYYDLSVAIETRLGQIYIFQ